MSASFPRLLIVPLLLCLSGPATILADEKSGPQLLPESIVFYAEVTHPRQLVNTILQHPLRHRLETVDRYREALNSKEYRQLKAAVRTVETELDKKWPEILASLTDGGLSLAFDADSSGFALLAKADDPQTPEKLRDVFLTVVRGMTQLQGKPDPVTTANYRGVQVNAFNEIKFAIVRDWLVLTNQSKLGRQVVDRLLDGAAAPGDPTLSLDTGSDPLSPRPLGDSGQDLARNERFQAARRQLPHEPSGWMFADVETIRNRGVAEQLFRGRSGNPLIELIVGGLLSNLQRTPWAAAAFEVQASHVRLTVASPHDATWVEASRNFYFGPHGTGVAPELLSAQDAVLTLSTYRDVADLWLHADELFDPNVTDGFAQAESALSTLFSGKEFGEEVLGAVRPEIQLVVTRQNFGDRLPQPAIKLPAFAIVLRLKEPEAVRDDFRRTFQSLMGFLNVVGAMNAQPQLDFAVEKGESQQILTSSFVAESGGQQSRQAAVNFNFSPAVAFIGERMVVSSDTRLARDLGGRRDEGGEGGAHSRSNTQARFDPGVLHQILVDNRSQLIAQNMLEEGNSNEEAAQEVDALLQIVHCFRLATLRLDTGNDKLELQIQVDFNVDEG